MNERRNPFDCAGTSVSSEEKMETAVFLGRWLTPVLVIGGGLLIDNPGLVAAGEIFTTTNILYTVTRVFAPLPLRRFWE